MKYLSLFSGIGGFELGIKQAHESHNEHAHIGKEPKQEECPQGRVGATHKHGTLLHDRDRTAPLCVGYSEIDKYAIQIYQSHFPEHKNYGDITKIITSELSDFDFLIGGFPCQSFSIAGKRKGFEDTRGTLFFEIARILQDKRPRYFLLENVKGLLSHDNGNTFKTIISALDELGYDVQWQVLNSKNFGVPQNRERVFIIGHLRGTPRPKVFPFGENGEVTNAEVSLISRGISVEQSAGIESDNKSELLQNGKDRLLHIGTLRTHKDGQGFREIKEGISPTIPARAREDGSGQPIIIQTPRGHNKGGMKKIAPTISKSKWEHNNHLVENMKIRRLTPKECERLQGFPDNWTEGISDTQRYKCLGNAVTVNVIEAIMKKLTKE